MKSQKTIAICIATFRRRHLLLRLLTSIAKLRVPPRYRLELRVVDNDEDASARDTVANWTASQTDPIPIWYTVEPQRNIAAARNRALDLGPADLVAFIDDDERPDHDWLLELACAIELDDRDAVFGEVVPDFVGSTPRWALQGGFFHKHASPAFGGSAWRHARTSNALVAGAWFYERRFRFREEFGRTGGEDTDLFRRMVEAGARLGFTDRARVTETVHDAQCTLRWLLARYRRCGRVYERLAPSRVPLVRTAVRCTVLGARLLYAIPVLCCGSTAPAVRAALGLATTIGGLEQACGIRASSGAYASAGCN